MRKEKLRKLRFFANAKDILAFRKRQFENKDEPKGSPFESRKGYMPDMDPKETNHERVVRQRLQSGRLGKDKDKDLLNDSLQQQRAGVAG